MDLKINQKSVVVFDLDDTLYQELDFLKSAYTEIAQRLHPDNWKPLYAEMFSLYRKGDNVFEWLANTRGIEKNHLIAQYRCHKPNIQLNEGALDTLNFLKSVGAKIGILTDGRSDTQRNKIKALSIEGYLDKTVISEEIGSEKPDIRNYQVFEDTFGTGYQYYYIGDNHKKDFITPNTMGWKTICLIDCGLNIHHNAHAFINQKDHKAQYYLTSLKDLAQYFCNQ